MGLLHSMSPSEKGICSTKVKQVYVVGLFRRAHKNQCKQLAHECPVCGVITKHIMGSHEENHEVWSTWLHTFDLQKLENKTKELLYLHNLFFMLQLIPALGNMAYYINVLLQWEKTIKMEDRPLYAFYQPHQEISCSKKHIGLGAGKKAFPTDCAVILRPTHDICINKW